MSKFQLDLAVGGFVICWMALLSYYLGRVIYFMIFGGKRRHPFPYEECQRCRK